METIDQLILRWIDEAIEDRDRVKKQNDYKLAKLQVEIQASNSMCEDRLTQLQRMRSLDWDRYARIQLEGKEISLNNLTVTDPKKKR